MAPHSQIWKYRILASALRPNAAKKSERLGWGIIAPLDALNFTNDCTAAGLDKPTYPRAESRTTADAPSNAPYRPTRRTSPPDPRHDRSGNLPRCRTLPRLVVQTALLSYDAEELSVSSVFCSPGLAQHTSQSFPASCSTRAKSSPHPRTPAPCSAPALTSSYTPPRAHSTATRFRLSPRAHRTLLRDTHSTLTHSSTTED